MKVGIGLPEVALTFHSLSRKLSLFISITVNHGIWTETKLAGFLLACSILGALRETILRLIIDDNKKNMFEIPIPIKKKMWALPPMFHLSCTK